MCAFSDVLANNIKLSKEGARPFTLDETSGKSPYACFLMPPVNSFSSASKRKWKGANGLRSAKVVRRLALENIQHLCYAFATSRVCLQVKREPAEVRQPHEHHLEECTVTSFPPCVFLTGLPESQKHVVTTSNSGLQRKPACSLRTVTRIRPNVGLSSRSHGLPPSGYRVELRLQSWRSELVQPAFHEPLELPTAALHAHLHFAKEEMPNQKNVMALMNLLAGWEPHSGRNKNDVFLKILQWSHELWFSDAYFNIWSVIAPVLHKALDKSCTRCTKVTAGTRKRS